MSEIEDGGPAFPQTLRNESDVSIMTLDFQGMSLRDWFASQGLVTLAYWSERGADEKQMAERAYQIADALLEARKQ